MMERLLGEDVTGRSTCKNCDCCDGYVMGESKDAYIEDSIGEDLLCMLRLLSVSAMLA